ncbi:MAG: hypothetical protein QOI95_3726 [Acidimicrobiaceae bacterium]
MFAVIGIAAAILCLVVTRHRVGFDTDSGVYLGTAQNIIDGRGVTSPVQAFTSESGPREAASFHGAVPLTHYPPLYPLSLAAVARIGVDVELAARLIGALLLGLNLVLLALLARTVLPGLVGPCAVMLLALVGPVSGVDVGLPHSWLYQHGFAMSESMFIAFSLGTLVALERYVVTKQARLCWIAGALAGFATATRYVGIALVVTGLITVLAFGSGRRLSRAVTFGALGVMPIAVWTLISRLVLGGRAPRTFHLSNPHAAGIFGLFEGWLGLTSLAPLARHVVLAGVIVLVAVVVIGERRPLLRVLAIYPLLYGLAVIATRMFLDASTSMDDRVFSPLQGPFYVLLLGALATRKATATRALTFAVPIVLVVVALPAAWRVVDHGILSAPPAEETFAATNDLPPDAIIATNVPTRLWEVNGRWSINVPVRTIAVSGKVNGHFDAQLQELVDVVTEQHGYIVLLGSPKAGLAALLFATEHDFERFGSLRVARRTNDGVILVPR